MMAYIGIYKMSPIISKRELTWYVKNVLCIALVLGMSGMLHLFSYFSYVYCETISHTATRQVMTY